MEEVVTQVEEVVDRTGTVMTKTEIVGGTVIVNLADLVPTIDGAEKMEVQVGLDTVGVIAKDMIEMDMDMVLE